jgi:hypothetical protein
LLAAFDIHFEILAFVLAMSRKVAPSYTIDQLKRAFKLFESDQAPPGIVLVKDIVHVLSKYGQKDKRLSKEEAEVLLMQVRDCTRMKTFRAASLICSASCKIVMTCFSWHQIFEQMTFLITTTIWR